jgi:2-methylcitrate dehydratase PrpD
MLAARAVSLRYHDLEIDARQVIKHCVLDWFGVTLAGSRHPLMAILSDHVNDEGGSRKATVVGFNAQVSLTQAALLNGAASHALDYDDVNMAMIGHPTVAVLPAVLALAEHRRLNGRDVMAAFAAGVETACSIGAAVNPSHYSCGWHATATLGCFAAAAAAANALGLDDERAAHAFGIAGTQAAGLKGVFGTMCKPLHAGRAASTGLQAALLAARGFTSNPDLIEMPQGFAETYCENANLGAAVAQRSGFYLPLTVFKYHAACYLTHSAIEASRALVVDNRQRLHDLRKITVRVDPGHLTVCDIAIPKSGAEIKFSLRTLIALTILGEDTASEGLFNDATAARSDVVALRDKVSVETRVSTSTTLSEVILHFSDGACAEKSYDAAHPSSNLTLQGQKLRQKFLSLTTPIIGKRATALARACENLDELSDTRDLVRLSVA